MKKALQFIYTIGITIGVIISCAVAFNVMAVRVSASEKNTNVHPEQMTVAERYGYMNSIVSAIVENKSFSEIGERFTGDCYTKLMRLNINFPGSVYYTVNDSIRVNNSSDNDYVLISNVKIQNGDVNNIFAFEFHINQDGKIYGFNIWSY